MPEPYNTDNGAAPHGIMIPPGRTTRIVRTIVGLLMATLVAAVYAGLVALIVPIVVLRSGFGGGGRPQRRVRAPATELLLGRSAFPATTCRQPQRSPAAT